MKTLIIGFSRSRSPWKIGSKIIQITENRNYSHVYIRYECDITGEEIVAQASHGFVNEMNYEIFKQTNVIVEEYKMFCNTEDYKSVLLFIKKNLGIPYSKTQIIAISIKKLLRFEMKITNKDQQFICSELAARVCKILKIQDIPEELDYITPSDFNKLLQQVPISICARMI